MVKRTGDYVALCFDAKNGKQLWRKHIGSDSRRYPRNNLAHCFSCGRNFNNIDLLMALGYDFPAAVEVLEQWLRSHREHHTSNI
jgi:hypothetical protein